MPKRIKTDYPGVYYRIADRIGGRGPEKVFYVTFKREGKMVEAKVGRQYVDDMTPARASRIRAQFIEGKQLTQVEQRAVSLARKAENDARWTIDRLWSEYRQQRRSGKALDVDTLRYDKYIKEPFGKKEPSEVIALEVDQLRIKLSKKLKPQTVKHILNLLTWIVHFGVKKGLCAGFSFKVTKPEVHNLVTEDLTSDELKRLLDAIDADHNLQVANLMRLALYTGMRRGELFKLEWRDVNFDRGFIKIRDPKGGPSQSIPLNDAARQVLENHPRTPDSPYVFPGRDGKRRVAANHDTNRIKRRAGLPKSFRPLHGLRHCFASMLASSGKVDMYALQKLLTHKSPIMTQRYAHLRDEALKRASDVAAEIIETFNTSTEDKDNKVVNLHDQK